MQYKYSNLDLFDSLKFWLFMNYTFIVLLILIYCISTSHFLAYFIETASTNKEEKRRNPLGKKNERRERERGNFKFKSETLAN